MEFNIRSQLLFLEHNFLPRIKKSQERYLELSLEASEQLEQMDALLDILERDAKEDHMPFHCNALIETRNTLENRFHDTYERAQYLLHIHDSIHSLLNELK